MGQGTAAYRGPPCSFCPAPAIERCPRCRHGVCQDHGLGSEAYCAGCRKELRDDLEAALFGVAVHEAPLDRSDILRPEGNVFTHAVGLVAGALARRLARRRARRAFATRTPAEIADRRRRVGG